MFAAGTPAAQTPGPVALLRADVNLVAAVAAGNEHGRCARIVLWRPGSAPVSVKTHIECGGGTSLEGLTELALAGSQVAWLETNGGNNLELIVNTASLARPKEKLVSYVENGNGAAGNPGGDYTGHLAGKGSLLVFASWTRCDPYVGEGAGYAKACAKGQPELYAGALHRIGGGVLRRGGDALFPALVDGGRILVRHDDGTLLLLDGSGRPLRTLDPGRDLVDVALQGAQLVALRPAGLEVYDAGTGSLVKSFRLAPAKRTLADVQDGVAVLVGGHSIHLIRLVDGRGRTIVPPGSGQVHAQLERGGLFYSYGSRLAFLPFGRLFRD